ncbi:MAG: hypothetical protein LHW45_03250 [Candidatus Cloacimonetes bacterium]|nr:hypothetical protein [Candidatus Cloacimonadota bacterium]MDD3144134.1 hypothetical protein [Candidatus Cloacimonadota bacterium]MDY0366631.1 hypothetical protein [Candidatus Syntrophosphaera sp.]HOY84904.1 hypothetical protein [Candidatus Syntrophosphaera sp.]HPH60282.1 hypothetical protein [Candidatus Syntrophosphaera sp.]
MTKQLLNRTMAVLIAIAAALAVSACSPNSWLNSALPNPAVVAQPASSSQVPDAGTDAHFVRVDEFLVMEQPLATQPFVYASLGRMQALPTPDHNNQGRFLRLLDSQQIWTSHYSKTRIAKSSDITLDTEVFFLQLTDSAGYYRAPQNLAETSGGWWIKARISDISTKNNGYVKVSGGHNVRLNALRVAVN